MKHSMPYFVVGNYLYYSRQYQSLLAAKNMVLGFHILFISLNIVYLFSLALVSRFAPIFRNCYNLTKNVIRITRNIWNIFLYILLLNLLGFGKFLISSLIALLNCSLGCSILYTIYKVYFTSDDGYFNSMAWSNRYFQLPIFRTLQEL